MNFNDFLSKLFICSPAVTHKNWNYYYKLHSLLTVHYKLFPKYRNARFNGLTVDIVLIFDENYSHVGIGRYYVMDKCVTHYMHFEKIWSYKYKSWENLIGLGDMQLWIDTRGITDNVSFVRSVFNCCDLSLLHGKGITLHADGLLYYLDDEFHEKIPIDNYGGLFGNIVGSNG